MKRAFLIARQEFIKYVTRRGFAISILMFPLWIVIVTMVPRWTGDGADEALPSVFTIVDKTGGSYMAAVLDELARADARRDLDALSAYAADNVDMTALRNYDERLALILSEPQSDAVLTGFKSLGGLAGALPTVAPFIRHGARPFRRPALPFAFAWPQQQLTDTALDDMPSAARSYLSDRHPIYVQGRRSRLSALVVIPPDFAPGRSSDILYFDNGRSDDEMKAVLSRALTDALRHKALLALAPQLASAPDLQATAALQIAGVRAGGGDGDDNAMASIVPIALAVILFVVSVMNSSVLLQGVIEEKSTRMIEVLLSCATPREITSGKLIGVIAVALTTLVIWAMVLFLLMALADQSTVALVFASLKAVASLDTLPLLLLFFLCGLLIYGSLFLAIGSMANSLADAQSLLGPSMLILMLPNLMISGVMHDPNGPFASTLSWVPIYTPFFMMLRIASHPPAWQLWGTTLLALATTAFLIFWTGRVFAKHVLTTERPPSLGALVAGLFARRA